MDDRTGRFMQEVWPLRADVLRLAHLLVRDDSEAEDLAQETMLRAYSGLDGLQPGTNARAWLIRILRNVRTDRFRAEARRANPLSLALLDQEPAAMTPTDELTWSEPQEILDAFADRQIISALQLLPDEIRWTLLLVDVEQMDHAAAAELLDVPVGTIKSRAHRGRAMLRLALNDEARETRHRLNLAREATRLVSTGQGHGRRTD